MDKTKERKCSLCGRKESEVDILLQGVNGAICNDCVSRASDILKEAYQAEGNLELNIKTPKEIKEHLDKYIIGQDDAK